jgi:hypothetical protein
LEFFFVLTIVFFRYNFQHQNWDGIFFLPCYKTQPTAIACISWYTKGLAGSAAFRHNMNTLDSIDLQQSAINDFFAELKHKNERLVYADDELASPENIAAEALAA